MNPMTPEELRELDAWIAGHVFGGKDDWSVTKRGIHHQVKNLGPARYTTDPAASDALDDAILKKLGRRGYSIITDGQQFAIFVRDDLKLRCHHPDKKICRALFAKQLWGAK